MKNSISKDSLALKDESLCKHEQRELNQFLQDNKEHVYELIHLTKRLQDHDLLTLVNEFLSSQSPKSQKVKLNRYDLNQLMIGIKKGVEEGSANIDTGKSINSFQLMKMLKDPDINRAVNFILNFLRGMGKNLNG